MDLSDFEAHAAYWDRQVELYPDDFDILAMRILAVADFVVQHEIINFFNDEP